MDKPPTKHGVEASEERAKTYSERRAENTAALRTHA